MDPLTVAYGDRPGQLADLHRPEVDQPGPVFCYLHGGGLEGGDRQDAAGVIETLVAAGVTVVSPDYRLYPHARYPDFLTDAAACVAWLQQEFPGRALVVGGTSAGAYLAMMLCFDPRWLTQAGAALAGVAGWVFDAGQPTTHFNVLRERGIDPGRVVVDDAAPLFHVGTRDTLAPTLILLAGQDVPGRREQTQLLLATLRAYGLDARVRLEIMAGYQHSGYLDDAAPAGQAQFVRLVLGLVREAAVAT